MKVLFIYSIFENLGIEYLSAVLKAAGHQTDIVFDPRLFRPHRKEYSNKLLRRIFDFRKYLLHQIVQYDPGLIAFSVVSADYLWACEFARDIKKLLPVPIVFGGIHSTSVPERVIKNDFVDFVVQGEGEYALLDLANCLEAGEIDYSIKNVWFKRDSEIISNPCRPFIQDLDSLPFADKDLFYHKVGPPFNIGHYCMARRGCHNNCTYCCNNVRRKIYFKDEPNLGGSKLLRRRSVDNVIEEMRWARKNYGIKVIRFNDDDFAESKPWLKEFTEKYTGELKVPYKCFVTCSSIDEDTTAYLKESGCQEVQLGVQHIDPEIRRQLGRPITNQKISEALRLLREAGIYVLADNLFGAPGEKEEHYQELANFYRENPVDLIHVYWLLYFPRTDVIQQAKEKGLLNDELIEQMEVYPYQGSIDVKSELHSSYLLKYKMLFETMNYFPKSLAKFITKYKIYYLFIYFNIFVLINIINYLTPKRTDTFPHPRKGYEINALRYPRQVFRFGWKRIKLLFNGRL